MSEHEQQCSYSDNFEIVCDGSETNGDHHTLSCLRAQFFGRNVSSLYNVTCIGRGCDDTNFYLSSVPDVFHMNCYENGCDTATLHAEHGLSSVNESNLFFFNPSSCSFEGSNIFCDESGADDSCRLWCDYGECVESSQTCNIFSVPSERNCPDDELCSITIDDGDSCKKMVINGSLASFLDYTVNTNCESTLIYCPAAGCIIHCKGKLSCHNAKIFHEADPSKESLVEIICDGDVSCVYLEANVENTSSVQYIIKLGTLNTIT